MRAAGLATMAYHYFDVRDVKKQDRYGLLCSLVYQPAAESDSCYDVLSLLYSDNAGGARKPNNSELTECRRGGLRRPGRGEVYIVVDALDEYPDISGVPSAHEKILELVEELIGLRLPNVHLCVASRPDIDIRKVLSPLSPLQISLHNDIGKKNDIMEYLGSIVHSDRKMQSRESIDVQHSEKVNCMSAILYLFFIFGQCHIQLSTGV